MAKCSDVAGATGGAAGGAAGAAPPSSKKPKLSPTATVPEASFGTAPESSWALTYMQYSRVLSEINDDHNQELVREIVAAVDDLGGRDFCSGSKLAWEDLRMMLDGDMANSVVAQTLLVDGGSERLEQCFDVMHLTQRLVCTFTRAARAASLKKMPDIDLSSLLRRDMAHRSLCDVLLLYRQLCSENEHRFALNVLGNKHCQLVTWLAQEKHKEMQHRERAARAAQYGVYCFLRAGDDSKVALFEGLSSDVKAWTSEAFKARCMEDPYASDYVPMEKIIELFERVPALADLVYDAIGWLPATMLPGPLKVCVEVEGESIPADKQASTGRMYDEFNMAARGKTRVAAAAAAIKEAANVMRDFIEASQQRVPEAAGKA